MCKYIYAKAKPLLKLCSVSGGSFPVSVLFVRVYATSKEFLSHVQDSSDNV